MGSQSLLEEDGDRAPNCRRRLSFLIADRYSHEPDDHFLRHAAQNDFFDGLILSQTRGRQHGDAVLT